MYVRIKKIGTYSENCARVLGLWVGGEVSLFLNFHYRIEKAEWNVPEDDILPESGLA
jgi:hypothetical protein